VLAKLQNIKLSELLERAETLLELVIGIDNSQPKRTTINLQFFLKQKSTIM
jgi:hypothetical protein